MDTICIYLVKHSSCRVVPVGMCVGLSKHCSCWAVPVGMCVGLPKHSSCRAVPVGMCVGLSKHCSCWAVPVGICVGLSKQCSCGAVPVEMCNILSTIILSPGPTSYQTAYSEFTVVCCCKIQLVADVAICHKHCSSTLTIQIRRLSLTCHLSQKLQLKIYLV